MDRRKWSDVHIYEYYKHQTFQGDAIVAKKESG